MYAYDIEEVRSQTISLQFLLRGWNGYDALPASKGSVARALRWIDSSYEACRRAGVTWYRPNVDASAEGEVVFWWVAEDRTLSIYVNENEVAFHQSMGGVDLITETPITKHLHGDAPIGKNQVELMKWFGE